MHSVLCRSGYPGILCLARIIARLQADGLHPEASENLAAVDTEGQDCSSVVSRAIPE